MTGSCMGSFPFIRNCTRRFKFIQNTSYLNRRFKMLLIMIKHGPSENPTLTNLTSKGPLNVP